MSTPKKLAASAAVLAAVTAFVSFGVFSGFTDTRTNTSTISSAAFALTQTPSTNILGTITGLLPGGSITRCVKLTNDSDIPVDVVAAPSLANVSTGTLLGQLTVTLDEVASMSDVTNATQCAAASLTGLNTILNGVSGTAFNSAGNQSLGQWAAGVSHYFRVKVLLPSAVTDSAFAGKSVTGALNFTATQPSSGLPLEK